jgi:ABC-type sugar transport system ATPase subunit
MSTLPIVAITLGDPAGTGSEIILKALAQPDVRALGRMLILGDAATLDRAQTYTGTQLRLNAVSSPEAARFDPDMLDVLDLKNVQLFTRSAPFDLAIRGGEVTGIIGLLGSGKSELGRGIFGADSFVQGSMLLGGKPFASAVDRISLSQSRRPKAPAGARAACNR